MLKNLLVTLDGSNYFLKAVEYATRISQQTNAKIHAIAPANHKNPEEALPSYIEEQIKRSTEEFKLLMIQHKIPKEKFEVRQEIGDPFKKIIRESVFCDLLVMGKKCHFPPQIEEDESLPQLLYHSSRPILFTPAEFRPIEKIVIGLDGTASSSRLIHYFIRINPFPNAKIFLVHTQWEEKTYEFENFFPRIEKLFNESNLPTKTIILDKYFEDALLDVAEKEKADMVAFGILDSNRKEKYQFSESLARSVMEKSPLPLFTLK